MARIDRLRCHAGAKQRPCRHREPKARRSRARQSKVGVVDGVRAAHAGAPRYPCLPSVPILRRRIPGASALSTHPPFAGRREDARFLTGAGRYVTDLPCPGALHLHVLRSPHAHAVIAGIDSSAAMLPGVVRIVTAADLADLGPIPCTARIPTDGPMHAPPRWALAAGRVRYVGEPVAAVVAETAMAARDAAELIDVAYDPLPA